MKKLKKLTLGESMRLLSNTEMKFLKGGGVYCHCKGNSGTGISVDNCEACFELCGGKENVQNCNPY